MTYTRTVWIRYYGRWYQAWVDRIVGKGAWVDFTTHSRHRPQKRHRWVSPERHGVRLSRGWAEVEAERRGHEDFRAMTDAATQGEVRLDDGDFIPQALANAIDSALERQGLPWSVNRGDLPPLRVGSLIH